MEANNSQKLREALEETASELKSYCYEENKTLDDRFCNDPPDYTCIRDSLLLINRLVNSALSAPPRNCDVGTAEEQAERFKKFCSDHQEPWHGCTNYCPVLLSEKCAITWSQMPYERGAKFLAENTTKGETK